MDSYYYYKQMYNYSCGPTTYNFCRRKVFLEL